jgi:hypothetical protein
VEQGISCPSPTLCNCETDHAIRPSAALCQVYDSIFLDVPMSRVKFNVNTEYAYIQNFKILQSELPCRSPPHHPDALC